MARIKKAPRMLMSDYIMSRFNIPRDVLARWTSEAFSSLHDGGIDSMGALRQRQLFVWIESMMREKTSDGRTASPSLNGWPHLY